MSNQTKEIIVVGGGTAGSVLAARLSEGQNYAVTLLEAGPDHEAYDDVALDPARATDVWGGGRLVDMTLMHTETGVIPMVQGRILGGTSALNGLATLRGQPFDYDGWAAAGLEGWAWADVESTFIAAERDVDFGSSPIHGDSGPLPVRRWRRDEHSRAQTAWLDGMAEIGVPFVADLNDPTQLPGYGVFPATIDDDARRVTTSLAYLTPDVRARENLRIRTNAEVSRVIIENGRATGVILTSGKAIMAEEVLVSVGAIWSPILLMRSGIGPADHLAEHGIPVQADLPVGATMSDHLGPGFRYRHEGPRGGTGGPAQALLIGASNGKEVDYHAFPVSSAPTTNPDTEFLMAVFLLRSSGRGSVRLGDTLDAAPNVTAPPMPDDVGERLRPAFDRLTAWEQTAAVRALGCERLEPQDLAAPDAVPIALENLTVSYGHMVGTCPMGTVLDADCRVLGIDGLRVADASVMPTIPSGNTYLGCVMVAERIARKILEG